MNQTNIKWYKKLVRGPNVLNKVDHVYQNSNSRDKTGIYQRQD